MIHLFRRAGLPLALDVGSGAVHLLDEPAWALLGYLTEDEIRNGSVRTDLSDLVMKYGNNIVNTAISELRTLTDARLLYENDSYVEFVSKIGEAPVKAICLHIAHDCNLRCRYCFASTGGFGGQRKLMDFETAKGAIDLLIRLSEGRHNLEVDFFGGEPLMNLDVVRKTVEYARGIESIYDKNFRFTLTTNGVELNDSVIKFINAEMGNVVLSLDGRRDVNDRMRPQPDGSGSYDRIVPTMQKLVAQRRRNRQEYYVRGTYTRDNLDFDRDVLALYELGFDQISVEPVVTDEGHSYSIRSEDVAEIEASYERLLNEMIHRGETGEGVFNFFHFMLDLENGPCAIKRIKGCGCGNEYLAVTPDGDLYPCHQFVGNAQFRMGSVTEGISDSALRASFADAHLLNKPACNNCWAKLYCSGGCNANNFAFHGSVLQPHELSCELEKIRLECAIALQATKWIIGMP